MNVEISERILLASKGDGADRGRGAPGCPGELITSTKVGDIPCDGTVSTYALSQSSHLQHYAEVKEGVREVEDWTTSDLGNRGTQW